MEEETKVEQKAKREGKRSRQRRRFTPEEKLKAVRLHLQEGFSLRLVSEEIGTSKHSLCLWVKAYRERGEAGLSRRASPRPGRRLPEPVREKIVELKRANRWYGVKRIALSLQRWFFLKASPETVRQTLHEAGLMDKRSKPKRNMVRPRFFERASPNQMWQSDIFTFRLGGKYAYIVAFMDDYSRYIVGLGLYRSPTAEAVIETYRIAAGEYTPPKEMLTDRGRQYTNWRGKSRFELELLKDRVVHIVSRPQHPMTLGKVERFWATMWQEYLVRAQFDSFENAQERLRLWMKYYNHRRPHQGIGGLSPADRFFEIHTELKKTIQSGIQENLLELALRGQPKSPFYLVGRLDGQSVVLKAEKGKLKLTVDEKEISYDLEKGTGEGAEIKAQVREVAGALGGGEGPGGPGRVDRTGEAGGGDAGDVRTVPDTPAVAGPGDGRDASGLGAQDEPGERLSAIAAPEGAPSEAPDGNRRGEAKEPFVQAPGDCLRGAAALKCVDAAETSGPGAREDDLEGAFGPDDSIGGRGRLGSVQKDVLPVGSPGPCSDAPGTRGEGAGAPADGPQSRGDGAQGEGGGPREAGRIPCRDGGAAGAAAGDGSQPG
jgi:transposase InsO family protein